jgi:hypothetical protein
MRSGWQRGLTQRRFLILLTVAIVGSIAAWRVIQRDRYLTEPPPRTVTSAELPTTLSTITLNVILKEDAIRKLANSLPTDYPIPQGSATKTDYVIKGTPGKVLNKLGQVIHTDKLQVPYSVTVNYGGGDNRLTRGPIGVRADGGTVELTTRLSSKVRVWNGGIQATFEPSLDAIGDASVDLSELWRIEPKVNVQYHWVQPPKISLLGVDITLANVAGRALDSKINDFKNQAEPALNEKIHLRNLVEPIWERTAEPILISKDPQLWLQVFPRSVHFPTPIISGGEVRLVLEVVADTKVVHGKEPSAVSVPSLPNLQKEAGPEAGISIALPAFLDYNTLASTLLARLSKQPVSLQLGKTTTLVYVRDLKLYPAGEKLVVGLKVKMSTPTLWFDTNGWIFLVGKPIVDSGTHHVGVTEISFTRDIDNKLLRTLTAIGEHLLENVLEKEIQYDFSDDVLKLRSEADSHINGPIEKILHKPIPGLINNTIFVAGELDDVTALNPSLLQDAIEIPMIARGKLAVNVQVGSPMAQHSPVLSP